MDVGIGFLARVKVLRDELESIYIENMDFSVVEKQKQKIMDEIQELTHSGL
jgi:hypothetical protein